MAGKGDTRRNSFISRELEELRWDLALGRITYKEYLERIKKGKLNK